MKIYDPTDFEGTTPFRDSDESVRKKPRNNAATGASAAGMRAFTAQAVAFYFRVPVKAFFRTRVDYLASARAISPHVKEGGFSWHTTTPGLLAHAVKTYGWRFIPEHVLPPLAANVAVGAVLYTSYLQILGVLYEPSSHATKTVFPPPPPAATFTAGFVAGGFQSLIAAPLDALQVRFDMREGHYENKSMWTYGREKLREIGLRGIFAGWSLSFLKDSFGSGVFFATFEFVKAQCYYSFVRTYYGSLEPWMVQRLAHNQQRTLLSSNSTITQNGGSNNSNRVPVIRPHYALEPGFLMFAGMLASFAQQGVLYPLNNVQTLHYERLEALDLRAANLSERTPQQRRGKMLTAYYRAYQETWKQIKAKAGSYSEAKVVDSSVRRWLYRGFWGHTIRQVPSTSTGLIIFELVRRRYGLGGTEIKIRQDDYDILLS